MGTRHEGPICRLPVELVIEILANLDKTKDLLSVVSASRGFNNIFQAYKHQILQRIVKRQVIDISPNLWSWAVAAQKAALVDSLDYEEVSDVLNLRLEKPELCDSWCSGVMRTFTAKDIVGIEKTFEIWSYLPWKGLRSVLFLEVLEHTFDHWNPGPRSYLDDDDEYIKLVTVIKQFVYGEQQMFHHWP